MYCGVLALSPSTWRICPRQVLSTPSVTAVLGHTASSSVSLETTCPACATRYASTANGLGGNGSNTSSRHRLSAVESRRNGPKHHCRVPGILPPPLWRPPDQAWLSSPSDCLVTLCEMVGRLIQHARIVP